MGLGQTQAQGVEQRVLGERTSFITGLGAEEESAEGYLLDSFPVEGTDQFPEWSVQNDQAADSVLQPINEHENFGGYSGGVVLPEVLVVEQRVEEVEAFPIAETEDHMENRAENQMTQIEPNIFPDDSRVVDAQEIRADACQTPVLLSQLVLPSKDTVPNTESRLMEEEDGTKKTVAGTNSSGRLPRSLSRETRGDALPSALLVGNAFDENKKLIWSWLLDDDITTICIYGMGGVGKSKFARHIYNLLLKESDIFSHVCWISLSRPFNISGIQSIIAKCIGLDLSKEDDELQRAAKLLRELEEKDKFVLIFYGLWEILNLGKVGIPIKKKGCKLILTTRSLKICRFMRCSHKIKLSPLSDEESCTSFREELTDDVELPVNIVQIAKSIAKECAGLPTGIVTIARSLWGVDDLNEWRSTLRKLEQSDIHRNMEAFPLLRDVLYPVVRQSYDQLIHSGLKQCFLYCTLFPKGYKIRRIELIGYLIDEGIMERMGSRQEEFEEGHTMLNILENVCLLERCPSSSYDGLAVKMHNLVRSLSFQMHQETDSEIMVLAGQQLKELPNVEVWKENLKRASLMENEVNEIPGNYSPRCPSLSTLLLCKNRKLKYVAGTFFKQLSGLKILDLSFTNIEILPDSVSDLVTLKALLLQKCVKLRHVPSLKKLGVLRRLDLGGTVALENMPQDMNWLSNLRYRRFSGCGRKEFPTEVLPKLSYLQVLVLTDMWVDSPRKYGPASINGKEAAPLRKLETLGCHFEHLTDLAEYLQSRDETQSISSFCFFVGQVDYSCYRRMMKYPLRSKAVWFGNLSISRDSNIQVVFPNDIEELRMDHCNDARSLCDVSSSIKYATGLEVIDIQHCNSMECLLSSSAPLEPLPSLSHSAFSLLKKLSCDGCRRMKNLFPIYWLPNLVNLEEITVRSCEEMEEIIATRNEDGLMGEDSSTTSNTKFGLPKLKILKLKSLPKLISICSAKVTCDAL